SSLQVMWRTALRCVKANCVFAHRRMSQSPSSLSGKVAIITASTDGIGLATAEALGRRGAHVVVSSRHQANVDRAVNLLQSHNIIVTGTTCNVGKAEDREKLVQTAVDHCGGIDILVSNAAVNPFFGNIMDSTEEVWDKILAVNVKAAFLLTKLVVPHMEKRRGGNVVFVSSVGGYQPFPALGPYSVSKTALLGLTRALAPELAQSNIRVNCVAPGIIKTRFSAALWENEDLMEDFQRQLCIKRAGRPEEIGGVIAFLCSDDASYITGETITATGGMGCRL
uniref:Dehydrogenase/reductase SDR family member 4-like n=2 Tax=Gouania willdenowi TaxID=441366 RepID=A0A8C5HZW2_GOUWI